MRDHVVEHFAGPAEELALLLGRRVLSRRAAIIGVSVSDTPAEMRIETASVIANSRKSRPTTSPMKSSGISTAISET